VAIEAARVWDALAVGACRGSAPSLFGARGARAAALLGGGPARRRRSRIGGARAGAVRVRAVAVSLDPLRRTARNADSKEQPQCKAWHKLRIRLHAEAVCRPPRLGKLPHGEATVRRRSNVSSGVPSTGGQDAVRDVTEPDRYVRSKSSLHHH